MYHSVCSDAFHKSNPSSVPQGYVESYHGSLGRQYHVEGIPCWGLLCHTLANGVVVCL